MVIEEIRTLAGPNIFLHRPVLRLKLNLDVLAGRCTTDIAGFIDRLILLLPGLQEHRCSRRKRGGFIERAREGTYFGHVVEHVALELSGLAGIQADYGKTLAAETDGVYYVVVEFEQEEGMTFLLRVAVELVDAVVAGAAFPLEERISEARRVIEDSRLGPSTAAIVEAAERRGIPWIRLSGGSLIQFGYGKNRRLVEATISSQTSCLASDIASDKELTKKLLREAFLPVPPGEVVSTEAEAAAAVAEMDGPAVVKPLDGNQGKGVTLNVAGADDARAAYRLARQFSREVIVERMITGRNFRLLVVGGKLVAAAERVPAHVVGDGRHTVAELIEEENRDPRRGDGHTAPLTRLHIDEPMRALLRRNGLSLDSVPDAGATVWLCESANLSTGGVARGCTGEVHPSVASACCRAAAIIGLDICGVDLVTSDISAPLEETGGAIIEVNAAPGIRMHHHPNEGEPRDAGGAIIEMLYPMGASARIPIFSITGTNGKTTVTRMIAHVMRGTGLTVGMTSTDGIYIGNECIKAGDMTGFHSARAVLSDPSVEVAVLETARGGILRRGLGYDWCDVGVLTNIQPDHIGQDGIRDVEDLLHIKSLVAERVRAGGVLVLNGEDEMLQRVPQMTRVKRVPKDVIYCALDPRHPLMSPHLGAGAWALFEEKGWLVEHRGGKARRICETGRIRATMNGTAAFQVANTLHAMAALRAYGVPLRDIVPALSSFASRHNPGRVELFKVGPGYVLLDYGHNSGSFEAICRMAARWNGRRTTAVVGVPGDRADELLEGSARVAARGFDSIILREDRDLRGRRAGETAELLCRAIRGENPDTTCRVILDPAESYAAALENIQPDELVVMFYETHGEAMAVLRRYGAVEVESVEELLAPRLRAA